MIDKKQVMYDIERCISHVPDACRDCSHYTGTVGFGCMEDLLADSLALLKEDVAHELTKEEWEHWKKARQRDPICMIYKQDDTRTPIWVIKPEDVHEPAYLMGEVKLFTGKPDRDEVK